MVIYKLFWDEFASWYLEIIKPGYQQPIDQTTYEATLTFFDQLLHVLHPFMPFITEEIWHYLRERKEGESIMVSFMPEPGAVSGELIDQFTHLTRVVTQVRSIRKSKNLPQKEPLELHVKAGGNGNFPEKLIPVMKKIGNLSEIHLSAEKPAGAVSFLVQNAEYSLPLGNLVDAGEEIGKLEKELEYTRGFLASVMKKLDNDRFVNNAPEKVVEAERKKRDDARAKISSLEEQISALR